MHFSKLKHSAIILLTLFSAHTLHAQPSKIGQTQKLKEQLKEQLEFEPPIVIESSQTLQTQTSDYQFRLAEVLGLDTIAFTESRNLATYFMLEEVLMKDSTMTKSFDQLQAFGVKETRSEDGKIRIFSWKRNTIGREPTQFIIQYKTAPNRTRIFSPQSRGLLLTFSDREVCAIHQLPGGVYIVESKDGDKDELRFVAIDISTNVLRKAFVANKDDTEGTFKASREEFDKLYYNGAYLARIEEHLADSLFRGKIVRSLFYDFRNKYRITKKGKDDSFTYVAQLNDNGLGTRSVLYETGVTFSHKEGQYKFRVKNFDNKFCIENLNLDRAFRTDSIINSADNGRNRHRQSEKVGLVVGKSIALPDEWLIYTACCLDGSANPADHSRIRWAIEVDGSIEFLNRTEYAGCQIRMQMQNGWAGKTIFVIPYLKQLNPNISQATTVLSLTKDSY